MDISHVVEISVSNHNPSNSLRRAVVATPSPFRIFPRAVFAFSLRLPFGQFTHPFSRYPCIPFRNICRVKQLEGRKCGSKNKSIFVILIFLFFLFVVTMTMFLKYLRHKVDLVRCFTFNL